MTSASSNNDIAQESYKREKTPASELDDDTSFTNHFVIKKKSCGPDSSELPEAHSTNFRNILSYFQSASSPTSNPRPRDNPTKLQSPSVSLFTPHQSGLRPVSKPQSFRSKLELRETSFGSINIHDDQGTLWNESSKSEQINDTKQKNPTSSKEILVSNVNALQTKFGGSSPNIRSSAAGSQTLGDIGITPPKSSQSHDNDCFSVDGKPTFGVFAAIDDVGASLSRINLSASISKTAFKGGSDPDISTHPTFTFGSGDLVLENHPNTDTDTEKKKFADVGILNPFQLGTSRQDRPSGMKIPFPIPGHGSKSQRPVTADAVLQGSRMQNLIHRIGKGKPSGPADEDIESPMSQFCPTTSKYLRGPSYHTNNQRPAEMDILKACNQKTPIPMHLIFDGLEGIEKVGEGVYGEVFVGHFGENKNRRVYKIVPIEGQELVNNERPKTFEEILPEIVISKQLTRLHENYRRCVTDGYAKLYNARIATGQYPEILVEKWNVWDTLNKSDNYCPNFPSHQLYTVFEFEHAGHDVECFKFENAKQSFFLTLQIAHILAVGEVSMEFEHRDLHWGNILVQQTQSPIVKYKFNGKTKTCPSVGVKACIIDFTMARVVNEKSSPIYLDMKDDEEQFLGTGDHQFDIYRMMRDVNRNQWGIFTPKSNAYWVHYLAEKLACKARYIDEDTLEHRFYLSQLRSLQNIIMSFDSCTEFVYSNTCDNFKNLEAIEQFSKRPASDS